MAPFTRRAIHPQERLSLDIRDDYRLVQVTKQDNLKLERASLYEQFLPPKAVAENDPHPHCFGSSWSGRGLRSPGDHRR